MRTFDQAWVDAHFPEGRSDVMQFTLIWSGRLPASGNSSKTEDVSRIRNDLHGQMSYLWDTHNALQVLKDQGFMRNPKARDYIMDPGSSPREMAALYPGYMIDLCDWLPVGDYQYKPLVRKSLDLSCELKILFLRQDDPGALITQDGDIDGRMKTLLDALRMPSKPEQDVAPPLQEQTYCLLENDSLVSALNIETERLLFPQTTHPHEVHLVIEVSLRVLRVHPWNYCLL